MICIDSLDHLVLTVKSIEATCEFYTHVLGMQVISFADNRKALTFGQQKINLHQAGHEFEPKAAVTTCGSADLCFLSGTPIEEIVAHLFAAQVAIECGPIVRTGALGLLNSIYCRDPDGNLIEVANTIQGGEPSNR